MRFFTNYKQRAQEIVSLFETSFGASEGQDEGALIGTLVRNLMSETPKGDLYLFAAEKDDQIIAAVFMSRLVFAGDTRVVFMLAPVAVLPEHQGKGVGQTLIRHALDKMRDSGADIAVTYGDPGYYTRIGFQQVGTDIVPAPQALNYPHGWQAQCLSGGPLEALKGPSSCASAFNDPVYW